MNENASPPPQPFIFPNRVSTHEFPYTLFMDGEILVNKRVSVEKEKVHT